MYYLRYIGNGPDFMLLTEGIHTILSTDIPISNSDYDLLFERQREGKSFKLKQNPEPNLGLWGCVEEEQNPVSYPEAPPSETDILKEQVEMLDGALNEVLFTILPEMQGGEI